MSVTFSNPIVSKEINPQPDVAGLKNLEDRMNTALIVNKQWKEL